MLSDNHKEECISFGNQFDLFVCEYSMTAAGVEDCFVKPVETVHDWC
jgi:hypothetical protein